VKIRLCEAFLLTTSRYKTDRLEKIHGWLPKRKTILIGDSTQSDPESYGAIYRANPDWVKAIYIRKVTDAPFMEKKNKDERFTSAFKDVPDHVWKVFVDPSEIADHVKHIAG
jgi:phosphatidate phosphatase APP1